MKTMGKITITLILILTASLFLTSCSGIVTPGLPPNLENNDANDNATASYIKNDRTPPVVKITLPGTGVYSLNESVTATWTATDAGSGVVAPASGTVKLNTSSVGTKTLTLPAGTAKDKAGNRSRKVSKSYKVIIGIDKTPPAVNITLPGTGVYSLNESVTATWTATDAGSGVVAPASGTVKLNTSSVGTKTLTLPAGTAKDKAGNLSLQVTKSYTVIVEPIEETGTEYSQKWSGLTGFTTWYAHINDFAYTWLNNEFTEGRYIPNYLDAGEMNGSKAAVIAANAKGIKCIWGVGSGGTTITSANWVNYRKAILNAAQWAQDNGVYEFQIGNEEELHVDGTTMKISGIIANLKSVATDVQAIFTNGNISYSCWSDSINNWVTAGKGDIDILASNVYMGGNGYYNNNWKTWINSLVNAFGVNGTYLTEFGPSYSSLDDYSTDETVQAAAVTEMIEYIKNSGIQRALYYCWQDYPGGLFGVIKTDGTYRELWSQALLNSGSVQIAAVPAKASAIPSLANTVALIANNPDKN